MNHKVIDASPNLIYFLFLNCNIKPIINPINSKIIINILFVYEIINVWSGDRIHVNHDPEVILNILSNTIGIIDSIVEWFDGIGFDLIFDFIDDNDIRMEYEAVIPIDIIIIVDRIRL